MPKTPTSTLLGANYVYGMGRVSESLRREGIDHAFVGGTAVQALCCYLDTNKGAFSIKDEPARSYVKRLRPTDDYDIITIADEEKIRHALDRMQGLEEIGEHLYEMEITSRGWKNPSIRVVSTAQDEATDLRINFSVSKKDSQLLPQRLYEQEIATAEEVEFRGHVLQVPVRIVNPEYLLAAKIARNHNTSSGEPKDFYDARLVLEAIARYNTTFASLREEQILLDGNRVHSYIPSEKTENIGAFKRYLEKHASRDGSIDHLAHAMPF